MHISDASTGEHFAGKVIAKASLQKKKAKDKLRMEIRVHRSLHHKHIVKFVSYFEVADFYVIVLELCTNKSMMELLKARKRLTEPEARYYLAQMLSALKHMHGQRIIHRDLKLGNIFLNSNLEVKIGDFGLATQLTYDSERKKTICGTPNYIAPEVLQGGEAGHSYQVDIWSLGVVLYTWIIGKPPFETSDVKTTYKRIRDSIYYFPDRVKVSDEAKDLIKRMLQKNPDERPSLEEIGEHPFFAHHLTPAALPSTALVMEPKLPDMTKRIFSAPAVMRQNNENENINMMLPPPPMVLPSVPSTAAMHVPPPARSPGRGAMGQGGSRNNGRRPPQSRASPMANRDLNFGVPPMSTVSAAQSIPSISSAAPTTAPSSSSSSADGAASRKNRENIVDQIHQTLVRALEESAKLTASGAAKTGVRSGPAPSEPLVWIQRWGDYSSKYGLAYQYNTGSFGAYFNDSTIMVMDPEGKDVEYHERQKGRELKQSFAVDAFPQDLKKKVNLLQYFTNYLPTKAPAVGVVKDPKVAAARVSAQPLVYVRKWLKTRHAIFFRLTDNTLQVNFTDGTGVILSSKGSIVTFIDKKNQMFTLWLQDVWQHEQGASISSRLHYIKDMLECLINKRMPE